MRLRYLSHILDTICQDNPKSAYVISSFPPTGYQPAMTDNRKSCILNGESLSCPAPGIDHLMMSDVNKWRNIMQSLCQSYVLLTFLYVKYIKTVN